MCKSAVILGNGAFPRKAYPRYILSCADYLVCCDGAIRHLDRLGIVPDAIVGDLDSIPRSLRRKYSGIVQHCPDQETNDLTKAFRFLREHCQDADFIHILGATGLREDHTLANISLLTEYAKELDGSSQSIDMVSDFSTMIPLTASSSLEVGKGRKVSIFTADQSLKIKSAGLEWPTDSVVLDNWWKASLNRACEDSITLTFSHPSTAIVILD